MFTKWLTGGSLPRSRKKALMAGVVCIALAVTSGCALLPSEDAEEALPTIKPPQLSKKPEYTVKTETLTTKVRGSGKLMSTNEDDVFFSEDSKRIKEIYVKIGDQVQAGQLIAELDVSTLESELRQKKLQTRSEELKMIQLLRDPGEKSAEEVEQSKIEFELKRDQMVALEETIAKAKITAPLSGEVVAIYNKKGDMSKAYEAVATVADLSQLTVVANISTEDLKKVTVGMEATADINTAGQHKGTVKQLPNPNKANQNQNNGGYYGYDNGQERQKETIDQYLVVELETIPDNVTRGTQLSVEIVVQKKENALTIPLSALRTITGRNYVQIIDDKGAKREVDVELGLQTSTSVEILKGLTAGQKVVGR
jgi:membrane fusion protein, macrolide-specific efflux system